MAVVLSRSVILFLCLIYVLPGTVSESLESKMKTLELKLENITRNHGYGYETTQFLFNLIFQQALKLERLQHQVDSLPSNQISGSDTTSPEMVKVTYKQISYE